MKDSEQTLRNEFATKSALNELISRLEQLEGVDVQGLIDAAIEEFKKDSWLGEQMNEYIANYKFDYDYVNAEGAADAVLEQIKGQNEEYKEAILALIGSADGLTVSKEMLSDELKASSRRLRSSRSAWPTSRTASSRWSMFRPMPTARWYSPLRTPSR